MQIATCYPYPTQAYIKNATCYPYTYPTQAYLNRPYPDSYNEIIIDAMSYKKMLPFAVEAFFHTVRATEPQRERVRSVWQQARTLWVLSSVVLLGRSVVLIRSCVVLIL